MSQRRNCSGCNALCCLAWGANINATDGDIEKWIDNDAQNILKYISMDDTSSWVDPNNGDRLSNCPFLMKNNGKLSCSIYPKEGETDLRPSICGRYPMGKKCLSELTAETHYSDGGYEFNIACFRQ